MTTIVTISLTVYALTCKKDFTYLGGSLFLVLSALIGLGIFNLFIQSSLIYNLYTLGGLLM